MTRLILVLIFILLAGAVLLAFGDLPPSGAEKENPFLHLGKALDVTGACIHEGEIHYWASLKTDASNEVKDEKKLEEEAVALGLLLGFTNPEITINGQPAGPNNAEYRLIELRQDFPKGLKGHLLLQQLEEGRLPSRHISVSFTQENSLEDLADYAFKMPAVFGSQAKNSSVSYALKGHLEREISTEQMEDLADIIHQELQGKVIHGFQEGPLVSVTGYSPLLEDHFKIEDEKYNLNVALRYDDYQEKTVIWIGTPLIARAH